MKPARTSQFGFLSHAAVAITVWTLLVGVSAAWNAQHLEEQTVYLAKAEARSNLSKDLAFLKWATRHKSLYATSDQPMPPNPYLPRLPDRDITTDRGEKLTLMNPAQMMRQMMDEFEKLYGTKGKITGKALLNHANEPDPWELAALEKFDQGAEEVIEKTNIDGASYVRLMRPMRMEKGCVKCHGQLGFKKGDIRGGISVSVPLAKYLAVERDSKNAMFATHGGIWLVGLFVIAFGSVWRRHRDRELSAAERAIQEGEAAMQAIFENSPVNLSLKATDGRYLAINKPFADWLGLPAEAVIGKRANEILADKDLARAATEQDDHVLATGEVFEDEIQATGNDGEVYDRRIIKFPVRGANGAVTAIGTSVIDITDRKQAERELRDAHDELETRIEERTRQLNREIEKHKRTAEELRQRETRLNGILDTSFDAIIVANSKGLVESFNHVAERVFGYAAEEVIGENLNILMPLPMRSLHDRYLQTYIESGAERATENNREVTAIRKDGSEFPAEMNVGVMRVDDNTYFAGFLRDITERKRVEQSNRIAKEEAEAANRAKSEFLSTMSHELRTPMNAILGFSQLLESDQKNPLTERQKTQVRHVLKNGKHLLELIDEVLDLSTIEAGKLSLTMEAVDARILLDDCLTVAKTLAAKRDIVIDDRVEPRLPPVFTDSLRARQAILNLLSNAVKYSREGGKIWLDTERHDGATLRFSITDTGPGIPKEKQSKLFQPFNRLGAERSAIEGTGIGLVLTKRIIEEMGGTLGFISTPNEGCTFWVELPLAADNAMLAAETGVDEETPEPDADGQKRVLLYVEDDPSNLALMEDIVDRLPGLTMISTHTAELGLALAEKHRPDIIILDINLPGMDGVEAARRLKVSDETDGIPVYALSADAMPAAIERGMEAGIEAYLTKPINLREMMNVLNRSLSEPVSDAAPE